ncbi:hypothetical protein AVEN_153751-1 [Araneus ventricosus]|uniref:Uncharacterized protein n=1 Tax=Araneus ventricosus TaxID=182803 RepID=A0A4Y2JJ32_ARAVE|nr:hypothetical protein AVEN_153751-1 [Araneus ventricosus]
MSRESRGPQSLSDVVLPTLEFATLGGRRAKAFAPVALIYCPSGGFHTVDSGVSPLSRESRGPQAIRCSAVASNLRHWGGEEGLQFLPVAIIVTAPVAFSAQSYGARLMSRESRDLKAYSMWCLPTSNGALGGEEG